MQPDMFGHVAVLLWYLLQMHAKAIQVILTTPGS